MEMGCSVKNEFRRGDIFYVSPNPQAMETGCEQWANNRPAIIISNNTGNHYSRVVEIVYLTTKQKKNLPTHVQVKCERMSTALCETIYTVDKSRLGAYVRTLSDSEMQMIDNALLVSIGLEGNSSVKTTDADSLSTEFTVLKERLIKAETENILYKRLYEQLLEKMTVVA